MLIVIRSHSGTASPVPFHQCTWYMDPWPWTRTVYVYMSWTPWPWTWAVYLPMYAWVSCSLRFVFLYRHPVSVFCRSDRATLSCPHRGLPPVRCACYKYEINMIGPTRGTDMHAAWVTKPFRRSSKSTECNIVKQKTITRLTESSLKRRCCCDAAVLELP